jgi:hypothetical protein
MSLVTSASIWTNDNTNNNNNQKRVPVMRKTVKKMPTYVNSIGEPDDYVSQETVYKDSQTPSTIESTQSANEEKALRVNELLNKITSANEMTSNNLTNYNPIDNPIVTTKRPIPENEADQYGSPVDNSPSRLSMPLLPLSNKNNDPSNYSASTSSDLGNYGNYRTSYDPSKLVAASKTPYYSGMGIGAVGNLDDKLMQKINYMVHLLEEQQNEKTSNITEEFILYTFLGVFIIFVVDSFSRSGKYRR